MEPPEELEHIEPAKNFKHLRKIGNKIKGIFKKQGA